MSGISLIADTESGVTELSNIFIEHYMSDANEVQLKLYIYLLKLRSTGHSVEFSDIVDFLDFSERDVMRALHYWEEKRLIYVGYRKDVQGDEDVRKSEKKSSRAYAKKAESIKSIRFADPAELLYRMEADSEKLMSVEEEEPVDVHEVEEERCYTDSITDETLSADDKTDEEDVASVEQSVRHRSVKNKKNVEDMEMDPDKIKGAYTVSDIKEYKTSKDAKTLVTAAQLYFGRPMGSTEITSIMFLSYSMKMPADLIDYLMQHCAENKKDFYAVEKTAIQWHENGIDSVDKAKEYCRLQIKAPDDRERAVLSLLGRNGNFAQGELDAVHRWFTTYGFSEEIIREACNRTVVNVEDHRIAYAEKILKDWFNSGVSVVEDIESLDEEFRKKKEGTKAASSGRTPSAGQSKAGKKNGTFGNFEERQDDYDLLVKKLSKK
ncbi:MAG: DnaD domain protein [Lachnospiraceae bacterium]|nr:DnaD domain protein [Lachnospiraceae bacterium]